MSMAEKIVSITKGLPDHLAPVFAQFNLEVRDAAGVYLHTPEITALAQAASGSQAEFNFVPHPGPFARGIHVTVQGHAQRPIKTPELLEALREFYRGRPFVRVAAEMPHVKDVASSNYAFISGAANGSTIAVMCVIDNLVKGAAGGAMQWLNRLFGFDETTGLIAPAPGWT